MDRKEMGLFTGENRVDRDAGVGVISQLMVHGLLFFDVIA
jgi:hypothetical protein